MPVEALPPDTADRFARDLERHIADRTGGRVGLLAVDVAGGRVNVHGRAPSYYVKQLAIQACLEALGHNRPSHLRLQVEIEVLPKLSRSVSLQ